MPNLTRSVERVEAVAKVDFDLNTGRGTVAFKSGVTCTPQELWEAIETSGFTPVRIEWDGQVHEGPKEGM